MEHTDETKTLLVMGVHGNIVPYLFKNSGYALLGKDRLPIHGENLNDLVLLENPDSECYKTSWDNVLKNVYVLINEQVHSLEQDENGDVWGVVLK